ncbi:hypothetical protein GCM10025738_25870 [Microbacterium fluvii]
MALLSLLGVGAFAAGAVGGAAIAGEPLLQAPWGITAADGVPSEAMPSPSYAVNNSGDTYGSLADAPAPDQQPKLILVVATNGREGYVYRNDLEASTVQRQ